MKRRAPLLASVLARTLLGMFSSWHYDLLCDQNYLSAWPTWKAG